MKDFNFIKNVENIKNDIKNILNKEPYNKKRKKKKDEIIKKLQDHFPTWSTNNIYNEECPDIYAGEIIDSSVSAWFNTSERETKIEKNGSECLNPTEKKDEYKTIVIILESPHTDEYDQNTGSSIPIPNPALKSTGEKLQKYIKSLIKAIINQRKGKGLCPNIDTGNYRIILMESIPYQCSLGHVNGKKINPDIRDLIFNKTWELNEIKNYFNERLESYKPDFIINCCTGGKDENCLRSKVQKLIEEYKNKNTSTELYFGNHPSLWTGPNNIIWYSEYPDEQIKFDK